MLRAILRLVPAFLVLMAPATACGGDAAPANEDETVDVVASFYPLAFAAERVGGDTVRVTNLTPAGVEPHDLELSADDLEAIATADVVLTMGGGFQPAVEQAVEAEATGVVVDVLEGEHIVDPHVWLDPVLFAGIADRVAGSLNDVGLDPARVDANADELSRELAALDEAFTDGLEGCESRVMITNHAAFGYLAEAYDLTQEAISGVSPESEPDPARLAELAEDARADGVTTVFTESLLPPDVAETLADEAGLEVAVLNPLEGLTQEQADSGEDYVSIMRANLGALEEGLRC